MQLSTSEARAEASVILLRLLLLRLTRADARQLEADCLQEAHSIGHPTITEEVEWLFHPVRA
jgi:hypothetical protein